MDKISVVISYCSLENRFIDRIIEECLKFSDDIIVVKSNYLLDGTLDVESREFKLENSEILKTVTIPDDLIDGKPSREIHNTFRHFGWMNVLNDYVLFLDGDEVPNGDMVKKFLESFNYTFFNGFSFDAYWYFRDPSNQATTTEETTALFKTETLRNPDFFGPHERWSMFNMGKCIRRFQPPMFNEPMFHHYSWVRTKEEMLKKVSAWGHAGDKDWTSLVEKEFEKEFDGTDFVHGYSYRKVDPFI